MDETTKLGERRAFLAGSIGAGAGLLLVVPTGLSKRPPAKKKDEGEITPTEDLMREHGVLERILLIYEEVARRLSAAREIPADTLTKTAGLVRKFIEDYHAKLEEDFVFPRFEKVGKLVELVTVLRRQHERGRGLTDQILRLGTATALEVEADRRKVVEALAGFVRMFRPHIGREDTVLFPAFRGLVGEKVYVELGEQFEDKEHALFGEHGFEQVVGEVAKVEQALGIHDLAAFTTKS